MIAFDIESFSNHKWKQTMTRIIDEHKEERDKNAIACNTQ